MIINMFDNEPKVSVIIAAYNAKKFLHNLLLSIDKLFYSNYELIFVDDGSTKQTLNLLKEYCPKNNKCQVYHIENHGQCFALNFGIEKAKGEFIYFADADDALYPDVLNGLVDRIIKNKSHLSICSYWPIFGDKTKIKHLKRPRSIKHWKSIGKKMFLNV